MRRSAAPSVIAKKREERGKENDAKPKSNVLSGKGSIGRRKFKSPVASSSIDIPGGHGSDGPALSSVGNDASVVGRNASQVLKLMNSGRVEVEGSKDSPVVEKSVRVESVEKNINRKRSSLLESSSSLGVKRRCSEDGRLENEDIVEQGDSLLDEKMECAEEAPAISNETREPEFKDMNVPQSGTNRDVRGESSRNDDGELENSHVDTTMSKNDHSEFLLDGKDVPAILEEALVAGEVEGKYLNVSLRPGKDGRLESTVMGEQHSHVTGELDNGVVKSTKPGTLLDGSKRQRSLLHDIDVKVASKPCQEVVVTQHYSVMFCPWKPNTKRKGPWSDGVLVCQGRSCTLQDLDGKAISKAVVQGLKDMPEGATVQVGKFEVEVMRKASSEEVLSGAVYLADKAPQPVTAEPPALKPKKATGFKSFKLQQARTL